jgi:hypothetical protein
MNLLVYSFISTTKDGEKLRKKEGKKEGEKEREQVERPMAVGFPTGFSSYGIRQGERQSVDTRRRSGDHFYVCVRRLEVGIKSMMPQTITK